MAWHCSASTNAQLIANMVDAKIITSDRVRTAMLSIDRANFEPPRADPYEDSPQVLGHGATISAPHMHAMCLELLEPYLQPGASALDVGSGSGYLTAAMAALVGEQGHVVGIEHVAELTETSIANLAKQPAPPHVIKICTMLTGDGRLGFPDRAPFRAIHVGAAADRIPDALLNQLAIGGRLVVPVGPAGGEQTLDCIDRLGEREFKRVTVSGVRYVPLTSLETQMNGHQA